jgi:hypothetical protein
VSAVVALCAEPVSALYLRSPPLSYSNGVAPAAPTMKFGSWSMRLLKAENVSPVTVSPLYVVAPL